MAVPAELRQAWREFRKEHKAPIYSKETQLAMGDWAGGLAQGLLSQEVFGFIGRKITQSENRLYNQIVDRQGQVRVEPQPDGNWKLDQKEINVGILPRYLQRNPEIIPTVLDELTVSPTVVKNTLVKQSIKRSLVEKIKPSELTPEQIFPVVQAMLGLVDGRINLNDLIKNQILTDKELSILTETQRLLEIRIIPDPLIIIKGRDYIFDKKTGQYIGPHNKRYFITVFHEEFVLVGNENIGYHYEKINDPETVMLGKMALQMQEHEILISEREYEKRKKINKK